VIPVLDRLALRAQRKAERVAISTVAVLFLLAGTGFLSVAFWMVLAAWQSPLFATTVIGAALFGIGLILFAVARTRRAPPEPEPPPLPDKTPLDIETAIAAFIAGVTAGRATRK
jgi:hypothetical protein